MDKVHNSSDSEIQYRQNPLDSTSIIIVCILFCIMYSILNVIGKHNTSVTNKSALTYSC
jgi:hypothetical protein